MCERVKHILRVCIMHLYIHIYIYISSGKNGYDDRVGGCVCVRDVYIYVREDPAKEMNSSDTSPFRVRHCRRRRVGLRALKG